MTPNPSQNRSSGMRYERLFPLGSGGMATVELAVARGAGGFNRLVVLKSMRRELAGNDDGYKMFLDEARLSARLNHPNVVQVSEILETSDGVVLVMEYLDGAPLSNVYRVANEALTLPMRLRLICEVLAGLHYAHELADFKGKPLGVVHRDVSPQNVFVTYDGSIKLLDFGIAKAADSSEHTRTGLIKGRIAYMPAEQLTGSSVDRRTDLYAVGCLLWEAIAGGRMWGGRTERDIARGVLKGNLPSLSERVKVDPELERILVRATALAPDERYSTAEEMRADLESYLSATFAPVSSRDIGELLLKVSGEARENRRRAIADAIAALDSGSERASAKSLVHSGATSQQQLSSTRLKPLGGSRDGTGSSSSRMAVPGSSSSGRLAIQDLASRTSTRTPSLLKAPGSRRVLIAAGGIALLAAVVWSGRRAWDQRAGSEPPAVGTKLSTQRISRALRVEATPREARIFVDEQPATNPVVVLVEAGSEHVVRVEREGYEPTIRSLRVLDDVDMRIDLAVMQEPAEQSSTASRAKKTRQAAVSKRSVAAPATPVQLPRASATGKNCDPPYFFSNGNKTYKPECL